jgi:hypothetical protein
MKRNAYWKSGMVLIARMVGTLPGDRTGIVAIARGFPTLNCWHRARYEVAPTADE